MHIPTCDPKLEYLALMGEIDVASCDVLESGHYILGPNVAALEGELASYLGCKHAVGVNSGTDALHLALRALDIGPGDEVITTPFTFIATTEAIGMVGATPVFVDINPRTFNIDASRIEDAITSRTKIILPVHLYGQPSDMDAIMDIANRHQLAVVEDCAQAIGAMHCGSKVGTIGTVGCFSFFPSKNLGCFGDGGLVVSNDPAIAARVEMLRRHGGAVKYHHSELGLNSRLDDVQAAILRVKLKHLDARNSIRRRLAQRYNELLVSLAGLERPYDRCLVEGLAAVCQDTYSVYNQYTVQVAQRSNLTEAFSRAGIGSAIYYPVPLHLQAVNAGLSYGPGSFPHAEAVAKRCFSLPMYPELKDDQQVEIARVVTRALQSRIDDRPLKSVA